MSVEPSPETQTGTAGRPGPAAAAQEQRAWTVLGREVSLPVEVRRAAQWGVQYLVPAAAAQRLVDPTGLEVTGPVPGRALVALAVCRYDDTDLDRTTRLRSLRGPSARRAARRASAQRAREFATGAIGTYIHRLPVDQEFTCAAGRDIWGFPKWVTSITIDEPQPPMHGAGGGVTVRLVDDGVHVLTLTVAAGGRSACLAQAPRATPSATASSAAPSGRPRRRARPAGRAGPRWCSDGTRWPTSSARSDCPGGPSSPRRRTDAGRVRGRRDRRERETFDPPAGLSRPRT